MTSPEGVDSRAAGYLQLAQFLDRGRLKRVVADLEYALHSANGEEVAAATTAAGMGGAVGQSLFGAALQTVSNSAG